MKDIAPSHETIALYEPLTVSITTEALDANPFDPDEVRLDARISCPSGRGIELPCCYVGSGTSGWQWEARFAPMEVGTHTYEFVFAHGSSTSTSGTRSLAVEPSSQGGFLRINPNSIATFRLDSGQLFRGVGENFGWESRQGDRHTYASVLPRLAELGCNFIRTWMCPWNLPLEWSTEGLGRYDLAVADQLDEVLRLAERHGIYIMLALDYHGVMQPEKDYWGGNDEWNRNPYSAALGGPCKDVPDFFVNPEAKSQYKKRLRYLVARWGFSPHVAAWEFWNEIEHIKAPKEAIVAWHAEMATHLKEIDPYGHLVSTSSRAFPGLRDIDALDFSQNHPYGPSHRFWRAIDSHVSSFDKPHVIGEFAYDWRSPGEIKRDDLFEIELHLGLWRGLFMPTPVLPMTWWWDHHADRGEDRHFGPVARFSEIILAEGVPPERVAAPTPDVREKIEVMACKTGEDVKESGVPEAVEGEALTAEGVEPGEYRVRWFDTDTGEFTGEAAATAGEDGKLRMPLPPVARDVAGVVGRS